MNVVASRDDVWPALIALIEAELDVGAVLSLEPPWRYCYEAAGSEPDLDFFEGTFVIRDDGAECHVSWGVVFDPDTTDRGDSAIERACNRTFGLLDDLARRFARDLP